jgi:putative ABC transport system permease protein
MIIHLLKIAFRNMRKYKTQSITAIFGLAFGLACFVPALYWLRYETSYDSFYPGAAHIYRVYAVEKESGKVQEYIPGIMSRKLHEYFPATETATGFVPDNFVYNTREKSDIWLHTLQVDSSFLRVFPQEIISGDKQEPLRLVYNMMLTETVAVRLFGDVEKAVGQQLTHPFEKDRYCTVTAVIKDPPPNTNLPLKEVILNLPDIQNAAAMGVPETQQWNWFNNEMYAKFHARTDFVDLAARLRDFTSDIKANDKIELRILPISDIRYGLNADSPFTLNFMRLLVAAGLMLLFSALFNFLNLHLDLFRQRMHELRQRAVNGAKRRQLTVQMLFELTVSIVLSLALACCLVVLVRSLFAGLSGVSMPVIRLLYLYFVCGTGVLCLILLVGTILFYRLSRSVVRHLSKRKITAQPFIRHIAVSLQLAVSVVFIVATLVVAMQIRFINRKDLGFDHRSVIQMSGEQGAMYRNREALINELTAIPQIESITSTLFEPQHNATAFGASLMNTEVEWQGKASAEKPAFQLVFSDSRFAETFKLNMLTGKWWGEGEKRKVVLNEEAVRIMRLDEPVGATIRMSVALTSMGVNYQEYEVVGVVKDFHTLSFRNRIYPAIFSEIGGNHWYVRVTPGQEREAMQRITAVLPAIDASLADVSLTPLEELFGRLNYSEQAGLKIFSVLATVCLLISLFGIYAVASAATRRRRKEIAIRKVVGAQVGDIIRIFFREYTFQVMIAGVVALPLAYYAMHHWLQGYAYRTIIPWWLLTGVIAGIIAVVLLTVTGQVLKAANSNPAKVVKSE